MTRRERRGGVAEDRRQSRDLVRAAAGQQTDDEIAVDETEAPPRVGPARRPDQGIGDGVADELDRNASLAVERALEGQHRQDETHPLADHADASGPPRPDLWRDEVDDRDTGVSRRLGEAEVESRVVDRYEHVGTLRAQRGAELGQRAAQARQTSHRLGESDDRHVARIGQQLHASRGHAFAAHPEQARLRRELEEGRCQCSSVEVARHFPRRQHHEGTACRLSRHHRRSAS